MEAYELIEFVEIVVQVPVVVAVVTVDVAVCCVDTDDVVVPTMLDTTKLPKVILPTLHACVPELPV